MSHYPSLPYLDIDFKKQLKIKTEKKTIIPLTVQCRPICKFDDLKDVKSSRPLNF